MHKNWRKINRKDCRSKEKDKKDLKAQNFSEILLENLEKTLRTKNSFFQFKHFRVNQAHTAMKVSTEACILGAYACLENPISILDIGTGTGLLALMLAQRFPKASIKAVEIEKNAFAEAKKNVAESIFAEKIEIFECSVQAFAKSGQKFDLIVSNPPFYHDHLVSTDAAKNLALHQKELSFKDLAMSLKQLLSPKGLAYILLPPYQMQQLVALLSRYGLFPQINLSVYHSPKHTLFRHIVAFGFEEKTILNETLYIKDENENYTEVFKTLLKEFYLAF